MKTVQEQLNEWASKSTEAPKLSAQEWNIASLLGIILMVMAVLQVISFNDFKATLGVVGLSSSPAVWAVIIIVAEAWGALGFFKIRLRYLARYLSGSFAILVSGFWFYQSLKLLSEGSAGQIPNSGFFGKYLHQSPGWWTAVEISILLFWALYSVKLTNSRQK